ncbi:MAG: antibiotic biosynthesis monooxygenase [Burkholderiaceae bacterium]|jgi:heme-degrading monooxygenase HmoA|nr:MAG: antibiotic biosynthesis monooxygenase [Burkholderiaceae bacterium]
MIAVIFEVEPSAQGYDAYLEHAARLRPLLEQIDGFISVERFRSLSNPNKLVSLSFWRDEASVRAWREQAGHRATQAAGRAGIFDDYRLRVANVVRDYGLYERGEAPPFHAPVERRPRSCPVLPPTEL